MISLENNKHLLYGVRIIFEKKEIYDDPTVYVNISCKDVSKDAPRNSENWFVMINSPYNLNQNWDKQVRVTRKKIISKLEKILGLAVGKNIINESTLINGVKEFLNWCKNQNISMAVCTNKQEYLSNDLLKKIGIYDYFEYVAGSDTFDYCKPDPRHLTSVIEILDGDVKKSIMIGDSETDANAAKAAEIPIILLEDGYTEKNKDEIYHNHLIKDFIGIEKIISEYL